LAGTWVTRPTADAEDQRQGSVGNAAMGVDVTDDVVTLTQIATDPAGRELAMKMVIRVDGQEHPVQFGDDLMLRARWTDDRTLETIVTHRENVVSTGTCQVSADGQRLVVSTADQRVVFERM
jgi:hypothetical protein